MENLGQFLDGYRDYAMGFLGFLGDPNKRLFGVFLLTSLIAAYALFRYRKPGGSFREFVLPKSVWSHPQAWLDVRYFFFHGLIGHFIIHGVSAASYVAGVYMGLGVDGPDALNPTSPYGPMMTVAVMGAVVLIVTLVNDFISFYIHYLQHKIPLLWQFHKVHHSGEIMHPLSNFREHPVDNFVYHWIIFFTTGLTFGFLMRLVGYEPSAIEILGLSVTWLAFNLGAYHLRHSHIWLRWPGKWSMVFGSPGHHQVHHSRHVDHLDKNFAFLLPIWDVLFGTYCMPETNEDVEFGIVEDSSELNSCWNLYFIPFRDAFRLFKKDKSKTVKAKPQISRS